MKKIKPIPDPKADALIADVLRLFLIKINELIEAHNKSENN